MNLMVNGVCQEFSEPLTAAGMLEALGVDAARAVIERNGAVLPRESLTVTALADGDVIEIVQFVSGG